MFSPLTPFFSPAFLIPADLQENRVHLLSVLPSPAQWENSRCGPFTFLKPSTKDPLQTHTKEQGEGFLEGGKGVLEVEGQRLQPASV